MKIINPHQVSPAFCGSPSPWLATTIRRWCCFVLVATDFLQWSNLTNNIRIENIKNVSRTWWFRMSGIFRFYSRCPKRNNAGVAPAAINPVAGITKTTPRFGINTLRCASRALSDLPGSVSGISSPTKLTSHRNLTFDRPWVRRWITTCSKQKQKSPGVTSCAIVQGNKQNQTRNIGFCHTSHILYNIGCIFLYPQIYI